MAGSEARSKANRENARNSTGPVTEDGRAAARGNALKHGLSGAGVVLPDTMLLEADNLERAFTAEFQPASESERQWVRVLAVASVQRRRGLDLEVHQELINQGSDAALWNENLALRASIWGEQIDRRPDRATCELKRFSAGCLWLCERWKSLRNRLGETTCDWDDSELERALNLLGIPAYERGSNPRVIELYNDCALAGDPNGGPAANAALESLKALIDAEITALETSAAILRDGCEVRELDILVHGGRFDTSKSIQQLRRLTAAADRRFERAYAQLQEARAQRPAPPPPAPPAPEPPRTPAPTRETRTRTVPPASSSLAALTPDLLRSFGVGGEFLQDIGTLPAVPGVEHIDFAIGAPTR